MSTETLGDLKEELPMIQFDLSIEFTLVLRN